MATNLDLGGTNLFVESLAVGATRPGLAGSTSLSGTELSLLDTVSSTSGVLASKAVVANSSGTVPYKPVVIKHTAGATLALTAAQSGAQVFLAKADGVTVTLPASAVGLSYDFIVHTAVTSNAYKISTSVQGTEFFDGTLNSLGDAAAASAVFTADGSTHDNLSMNGTTTGGLVGTEIRVTCSAANLWTVSGTLRANGTEATPFATT